MKNRRTYYRRKDRDRQAMRQEIRDKPTPWSEDRAKVNEGKMTPVEYISKWGYWGGCGKTARAALSTEERQDG